jgi:porphobilinogen synthase
MVSENSLRASQFILPLFVNENISEPRNVSSMPSVQQHTLESAIKCVSNAIKVGIKSVILFGIPSQKNENATCAFDDGGIVQRVIRALKLNFPSLIVIADCCLCEYTNHGHCGVMESGSLAHEKTLSTLSKIAISYANAGVDIIAPSGMMDGMVKTIRCALDASSFSDVSIMSYSVKYASHFYGPFRDAAGSDQFACDRLHHQLNPSQCREAYLEASFDEQEGADFLMVKPAGFYMDIIRNLSLVSNLPIVAYHVSGEYSMVYNASISGQVPLIPSLLEIYLGLVRSGAQLIVSYAAVDVAHYLNAHE